MQVRSSLYVRTRRRRTKKQSRPTDTAATFSDGPNANDVPELHDGLLDDDDANAGIRLLPGADGPIHGATHPGAAKHKSMN